MIQELHAGDRQIPASGWNEMRAAVQGMTPGQQQYNSSQRNPVYITVKNVTGADLPAFSVVKLSGATYSRTGDTFINQAIANGVELDGDTPAAATDTIAITQAACASGEFVKAIADGCTPAFVYKDIDKSYKYAQPMTNQTGYLRGTDDATNIRILWLASGTGKQEAYVCLDATGEGTPLKCADRLGEDSDEYPDGATQLPTARTWLYCSAIDKIKARDDEDAPYVYNPLGLPLDRPTIVAKVDGFPGEAEVPTGSSRHIGDYVAVGSDVRDYFIINPAGSYSGNNPTTDENGSANDYYAKGNVFYTFEYGGAQTALEDNEFNPVGDYRLSVCQQDMPYNWHNKFRMASFSPESNMGEPIANTFPLNTTLTRCGVDPGERKFSQKRLDYLYSHGRYCYEPIFVHRGAAKGEVGGNQNLYIEINGDDYLVDISNGAYNGAMQYDIYPGDTITVLVNASEYYDNATTLNHGIQVYLIEGAMDFKEGTTIFAQNSPGRGWTDITPTVPANNYYTVGGSGSATVGEGTTTAYFLDSGFKWWQKNKDGAIK